MRVWVTGSRSLGGKVVVNITLCDILNCTNNSRGVPPYTEVVVVLETMNKGRGSYHGPARPCILYELLTYFVTFLLYLN